MFAAAAVAKTLASQLHGVTPFDAATLAGACAVMAAIGLLAILWPARRATRQDPARAERELSERKRTLVVDWKPEIGQRLANLNLEPAREDAIMEELAQDLEDCYAELLARGLTEAEAYQQTLAELSGSEYLRRELRRIEGNANPEPVILERNRRINMLADLRQDLRFSARMLMKQPGFTLLVAFTLAVGIGANTAIFSLVDAVLWRPLAAAQPERLIAVYTTGGGGDGYRSVSYADYLYYRDQQKSLSGLAAYARAQARLRSGERLEQIGAELVTGNFFSVLGLNAAHGRLFTAADDQTRGAHPVAVISHRLWRERFNQAPQAVGQTLNLNGQDYSIIGVAPARFSSVVLDWGKQPDVWLPMMMQPQVAPVHDGVDVLQNRDARWLLLVGRLKDGVELAQAEAELKTLSAQLAAAWPQHNAGRQALALPIGQARFWPARPTRQPSLAPPCCSWRWRSRPASFRRGAR
ncbi:MAG TPA: ABC transporter permease [Blastocatellia bacterium]